jgi:hypothetical protein
MMLRETQDWCSKNKPPVVKCNPPPVKIVDFAFSEKPVIETNGFNKLKNKRKKKEIANTIFTQSSSPTQDSISTSSTPKQFFEPPDLIEISALPNYPPQPLTRQLRKTKKSKDHIVLRSLDNAKALNSASNPLIFEEKGFYVKGNPAQASKSMYYSHSNNEIKLSKCIAFKKKPDLISQTVHKEPSTPKVQKDFSFKKDMLNIALEESLPIPMQRLSLKKANQLAASVARKYNKKKMDVLMNYDTDSYESDSEGTDALLLTSYDGKIRVGEKYQVEEIPDLVKKPWDPKKECIQLKWIWEGHGRDADSFLSKARWIKGYEEMREEGLLLTLAMSNYNEEYLLKQMVELPLIAKNLILKNCEVKQDKGKRRKK